MAGEHLTTEMRSKGGSNSNNSGVPQKDTIEFTPKLRNKVLYYVRNGDSMSKAAVKVGISRSNIHATAKRDSKFKARLDEAREQGLRKNEEMCHDVDKRAIERAMEALDSDEKLSSKQLLDYVSVSAKVKGQADNQVIIQQNQNSHVNIDKLIEEVKKDLDIE